MTKSPDSLIAYYDLLWRWAGLTRLIGYGGGRSTLTVHRALADPRAGGRPTPTRLHDVLIDELRRSMPPAVPGAPTRVRLLDAGCGPGGTMIDLTRRLGCVSAGITLSSRQVSAGRRAAANAGLGDRVRIDVGRYEDPPGGPFDVVLAIESLAHSGGPAGALRALAGVLVPGGLFVIVDDMPAADAPPTDVDLATFKAGWQCPVLWTAERYRAELAALGLAVVSDRDLTPDCRPRSIGSIRRLERLNRTARRAVPVAGWRTLMDSVHGGLALERLYRAGRMRYRLIVARM
jgi:SAM-dependent methyltransferase